MKQWISWYQPTEDYRPLTDPPHPAVVAWWCSGHSENAATLCALVNGTEQEAKAAVQTSWPEAVDWRFCEERPDDWTPGDRFPMKAAPTEPQNLERE